MVVDPPTRIARRLGLALALSLAATSVLTGGAAHALSLDTLTISAPADLTVTADQTCGQSNCTRVVYTFTASGGTPPYNFICTPTDSGGLFLVGTHTVSCLAQDARGNSTPQASFVLTVTPPSGDPAGGGSGNGSPPPPPPPPPAATPPPNVQTVSLGGTPRIGQVLTARVINGTPRRFTWQLERARSWRLIAGETRSRLVLRAKYEGARLRVRVVLSSGRVLYSPTSNIVHR